MYPFTDFFNSLLLYQEKKERKGKAGKIVNQSSNLYCQQFKDATQEKLGTICIFFFFLFMPLVFILPWFCCSMFSLVYLY